MPKVREHSKPLPQCEGPKLHAFPLRKAAIDFKRLLSDTGIDAASESGGHAHVFEISIGSENYALKVFKFYDDTEDRAGLVYAGDADRVPINLLHAHNDPFNKECRAFGRLIERKLNGIVAVGCYGYLTIPEKKEEQLEQEFNIGFERLEEEDDNENTPSERRPLCAIVKELIREDVPLSEQVLGKMLRDLKKIRAQGVYPLDIVRRNYKGGRLLDMSIAMTSPHYYFDIWPRWDVELKQREDLLNFDKMVEDEGIDTWRRAVRNDEYCSKLRSYKQISRQTSPDTDESGR